MVKAGSMSKEGDTGRATGERAEEKVDDKGKAKAGEK
jgi:hypothetical protein